MINPDLAVGISILVGLALLFIDVPVGIALGLGGMLGTLLYSGPMELQNSARIALRMVDSWTLLAVPLFILMGNIIFFHGVGELLFDTCYKWVGRVKGGLAMVAMAMGVAFGFACGTSVAAVATIGKPCLPEMVKREYDLKFSLGALAGAGGLSSLIPPSTLMIIYALIAGEISIGRLFIAGVFPGLILALLYAVYIYVRAVVSPQVAPPGPVFTWAEKVKSLNGAVPVAALFLTVIGGLYMGLWSAIEAGAAGAFLAFIICLAYSRLAVGPMKKSITDTVNTCVFIYLIVIGANIMAHVFYISHFEVAIKDLVIGMNAPRWLIVTMIMAIMMILGMFLDAIALMMITVPIFLPAVMALGYDPVWFGIIMIVSCEMAIATPPVGMSLFVLQGIAPKGTTLMDCAWGAAPFVACQWLLFFLLVAWPDIALWLPGTMFGAG